MGVRIAIAISMFAAGCGAKLEEDINSSIDASTRDSSTRTDAPLIDAPSDAPPADARMCAGGQARAIDPMTGSCFVYFVGPATHAQAETACTAFGSKLAVIKSAQTNATVRSLIGLTDAFIGGTDLTEGTWLWLKNPLDPFVVGVQYTNWRAGEPNNGSSNPDGEDCAIIEGDENGTWDDRPCAPPPVGAGAYAYICQF